MSIDESQVTGAVSAVADPVLRLPLGELGMVGAVRVKRKKVAVELALPVAHYPQTEELDRRVREAVGPWAGGDDVAVTHAVMDEERRARLRMLLRGGPVDGGAPPAGTTATIMPTAASSATRRAGPTGSWNPARRPGSSGSPRGRAGWASRRSRSTWRSPWPRMGHDVGILDADVYGFSVPGMLGVHDDPLIIGDLVVPPTANQVRCLSMGYFVADDTPVIWRGPMLHKALEQFLVDAYWGEPDFLLIDMPPGTGDVTLSLGQYLTRTEVYVVTTPQPAAERVAQRSAYAARKLKLSVRGVIENMSWFTGDDGTRYELFGAGGGRQLAGELGVPLLAQVPLVPALRAGR